MKWFWGTIWTAILGAVSALLVVAFQEPLKDALDGTELSADVYYAPWQPYPTLRSTDPAVLLKSAPVEGYRAESLSEPGASPLIMVVLKNSDIRDVEDVRLQMASSTPVDLLVIRTGKDGSRTFFDDVEEVRIGSISAGAQVVVYAWSPYNLSSANMFERMRAFSPQKAFVMKFHNYEDVESRIYAEPFWVSLIETYGPLAFIMFSILAFFGCLAALIYWEAYAKKLFSDDDFYLTERLRFEENKSKFQPKFDDVKIS